jgi:hypothetical protein
MSQVPAGRTKARRQRAAGSRTAINSLPESVAFSSGLADIARSSSVLAERVQQLAKEVQFTVATKTMNGEPIQQQRGLLNRKNFNDFRPREDAQLEAVKKLETEGCRLIRRGRFSVTMSGPAELVESLTGQKLMVHGRARRSAERATQMFATDFEAPLPHNLFLAPATSLSVGSEVSESIDHLVFVPPPLYFAPPSPHPPAHAFHAINEAAIRRLLNVPAEFDGEGIRVAIVDTGFFPHPYYGERGFRLCPTPTASSPNPDIDHPGHGTAIAYNIFAVAPKAEVLGFQQTVVPQDALEDAADAGVDVINCSWGWDYEQVFPTLQASLLSIVEEGKIVVFAAGNGHYAWPGSEPNVISVGGVYWNPNGQLEASNYASGFMSSMFPGRQVPDLSGLCGQRPKAVYIMMPTQPGTFMDQDRGGAAYPHGDGAGQQDGWVGASGTSSAAPQVAGAIALLLQKARSKEVSLSPDDVKRFLQQSSRAVTQGRNAMDFQCVGQPNTAVGYGLVDAAAALARV